MDQLTELIMNININAINIEKSPQPRGGTVREVVDDYKERMEAGDKFPPVELYRVGDVYILVDGFHRYHAAKELKCAAIDAKCTDGTMAEAVMAALRSNQDHKALRVSNKMKHSYVECALQYSLELEMNLGDRDIAELVGSSHQTVARIRKELFPVKDNSPRIGLDGVTRSLPKQRPAPATDTSDEEIRAEEDSVPQLERTRVTSGLPPGADMSAYTSTPPRRATAAATAPATEPLNPVAAALPGDSEAFLRVAALVEPGLHKIMRKNLHAVNQLAKVPDDDTVRQAGLLVFGKLWKVKTALRFLTNSIGDGTRLGELINRCIAAGGTLEFTTGCRHHVRITKPDGYGV